MSSPLITQALKKYRLSITRPRLALYEVLSRNEPMTMQELIAALPDQEKTTVYRNIELFEDRGIVQRLQIGFKYKLELSNSYQDHHHHATCQSCGRVVALPEDETLESQLAALAQAQGFVPQDHQIEIRGLCRQCAKT